MEVTIACVCGAHDTDTVTFRDRLDFRSALSCKNAIQLAKLRGADAAEILAELTEQYLVHGITGWSLLDEKRQPVEVTRGAIRERLLETAEAMTLADIADNLYTEQVLLPLLARAQSSSPPSPTDEPTSAKTDSGPTPLRRPRQSSTSTTQTAAIETTTSSPDGDSSTSLRLASGA